MMLEKNPWIKTDSKVVYDNPWITVVEDKVITPSGANGIYGTVQFKNKAIGIVPLDNEGNIYLVGQFRYPLNEYSWEIPEGGSPANEQPLETAKRELLEETGLTANHWEYLGKIHTSNSVCNEVGYLYIATDLTEGISQPESTEVLKIKKIPLQKAVEMVMKSEITDSMSMAAILMAWQKLSSTFIK